MNCANSKLKASRHAAVLMYFENDFDKMVHEAQPDGLIEHGPGIRARL